MGDGDRAANDVERVGVEVRVWNKRDRGQAVSRRRRGVREHWGECIKPLLLIYMISCVLNPEDMV